MAAVLTVCLFHTLLWFAQVSKQVNCVPGHALVLSSSRFHIRHSSRHSILGYELQSPSEEQEQQQHWIAPNEVLHEECQKHGACGAQRRHQLGGGRILTALNASRSSDRYLRRKQTIHGQYCCYFWIFDSGDTFIYGCIL